VFDYDADDDDVEIVDVIACWGCAASGDDQGT